ncbi:MAG: hypothetical protein ACFB4I_14300 [Cyanophyceae cyanobacterium]
MQLGRALSRVRVDVRLPDRSNLRQDRRIPLDLSVGVRQLIELSRLNLSVFRAVNAA